MCKIKYLRLHDLSASLPLLVLIVRTVLDVSCDSGDNDFFHFFLFFVILINLCAALFFCSCLFGTFLYNSELQRVKEVSVSAA